MDLSDKSIRSIKEIGLWIGGGGGGLAYSPTSKTASMALEGSAIFAAAALNSSDNYGTADLIAESEFTAAAVREVPSQMAITGEGVFAANMSSATGATVEYDSSTWDEIQDPGTSGTFNITDLTVASNSNRLLVAIVGLRFGSGAANTAVTGVTWNSNALTQRVADLQIVHSTRTEKFYLYDLTGTNVTTGNQTLAISWSGSYNPSVLTAMVASFYNVSNAAGVYEHTNTAGIDSTTIADSITPASASSLILVASSGSDGGTTWTGHDASLTEVLDVGDDALQLCLSYDLEASSTLNYTETLSGARRLSTLSASYENA